MEAEAALVPELEADFEVVTAFVLTFVSVSVCGLITIIASVLGLGTLLRVLGLGRSEDFAL